MNGVHCKPKINKFAPGVLISSGGQKNPKIIKPLLSLFIIFDG